MFAILLVCDARWKSYCMAVIVMLMLFWLLVLWILLLNPGWRYIVLSWMSMLFAKWHFFYCCLKGAKLKHGDPFFLPKLASYIWVIWSASFFDQPKISILFIIFSNASNICDLYIETIHSVVQPYDFLSLVPVIEGAGGSITDWEGNKLHWPVTSESRPTSIILISLTDFTIFCFQIISILHPHTQEISALWKTSKLLCVEVQTLAFQSAFCCFW
jgi:hypothetical protein